MEGMYTHRGARAGWGGWGVGRDNEGYVYTSGRGWVGGRARRAGLAGRGRGRRARYGRYVTLWLFRSVANLTPPSQILADFIGVEKFVANCRLAPLAKGWRPCTENPGPRPDPALVFDYTDFRLQRVRLNKHSATARRFLCNKINDSNVWKFGYNEQPFKTNSFFYIVLLVVSGTQCTMKSRTTLVLE